MQDLDISIKHSHRTAVAEARGSNFHVFSFNVEASRTCVFAGICHCVFYISYEHHIKIYKDIVYRHILRALYDVIVLHEPW